MSVQRLDRASAILGLLVVAVEAVQLALWLVAPQALPCRCWTARRPSRRRWSPSCCSAPCSVSGCLVRSVR